MHMHVSILSLSESTCTVIITVKYKLFKFKYIFKAFITKQFHRQTYIYIVVHIVEQCKKGEIQTVINVVYKVQAWA
jgi:hypothetical protein